LGFLVSFPGEESDENQDQAAYSEVGDLDRLIVDQVGEAVVGLGFLAPPEFQWIFIEAAVGEAHGEGDFDHIGAGPLEHLLVQNGSEYIDRLEQRCLQDVKFVKAVTGVWRNKITQEVWMRVQAIQSRSAKLDVGLQGGTPSGQYDA
jgi:hypothetical protein